MDETKINLDVETQTFRFTPSEPIDHEEAVSIGRGVKSGAVSYTHLPLPTILLV